MFTGVGFEPVPTAIVAVIGVAIITVMIVRAKRRR